MLCMYTLYFKRCTLYKFIEINSVLFLKYLFIMAHLSVPGLSKVWWIISAVELHLIYLKYGRLFLPCVYTIYYETVLQMTT